MDRYTYLIIGGGIAGVSAAETIRAHDSDVSIGIVSEEPHLPYSRVLLPSYLKKRIPRERVFIRTWEHFTKERIDFMAGEHASSVSTKDRCVMLASGKILRYEKLLITTGGSVRPWGRRQDQECIFRLQTLDDADRLLAKLPFLKNPIVIGSSFIALEFLEIFSVHAIRPTILMRGAHFFPAFLDAAGGILLKENLVKHGVTVHENDEVADINIAGAVLSVSTRNGAMFQSDALAVGSGIGRNTSFLQNSDIVFNERGIHTDTFLETNIEGVFAAGDVAEWQDERSGIWRASGNWTSAVLQGECAGRTMTGIASPFRHIPAYSITNLGFQITVLGDCNPGSETIVRLNKAKNQYARIFMSGGAIVGAFLINLFLNKAHLTKLIDQRINTEQYRDLLADPMFDIRTIPLVQ